MSILILSFTGYFIGERRVGGSWYLLAVIRFYERGLDICALFRQLADDMAQNHGVGCWLVLL